MSVKLILTDLDGTLLSSGQVAISERNMTALKRANEQGIAVVPCTGRCIDMLPPELLSCDFVRYVLACHGARVYDRKTGKTLYSDTLTPEESYKVLKIIEEKGIYAEIAADNRIYVEKALADDLMSYPIPYHHYWYMRDRRFFAVDNIAEHFLKNGIGIEKVNIYGMSETLQDEIYKSLAELDYIRFTKAQPGADLEFYHSTLDKVKALSSLLEELDVEIDEAFAIGDSMTDYDVIKNAGVSVAMGNALDEVKGVAKHTTDTNTADGVAKAIEKYVFSPEKQELPPLESFEKKHSKLVCIDSDGCAMDTMEIKHKECFCTAFIEIFGLQGIAKYAREAWDFTNLYSKTRGFYRMKTLIMSIELLQKRREVIERGFKVPDITPLREWCETYDVLSDATLREYAKIHDDEIIRTTLEWSAEVNRRVKRIVHGVPPFPYVRESLAKVSENADVVVVSATPTQALEKEWTEHGVKKYTSFVCGQEYGAKKDIISALKKQYGEGEVMMIGDAIGDLKAADDSGVSFYPIYPNREDNSWKEFFEVTADTFINGEYTSEKQNVYVEKLNECLTDTPEWDMISSKTDRVGLRKNVHGNL